MVVVLHLLLWDRGKLLIKSLVEVTNFWDKRGSHTGIHGTIVYLPT